MTVFIDTSAFFAMLDGDDEYHNTAASVWKYMLNNNIGLVTSGFVLIETFALIQHRLGLPAVQGFYENIYPLLVVEWTVESDFEAGAASVLSAQRRDLSLVDCVSFVLMRRMGIHSVFSFDKHFSEQGFEEISEMMKYK